MEFRELEINNVRKIEQIILFSGKAQKPELCLCIMRIFVTCLTCGHAGRRSMEAKEAVKMGSLFFSNSLSNGEKISSLFQARDFSPNRGTKTGVMQRIMRIFVTKSRGKRSALNQEVILSTLLNTRLCVLHSCNHLKF